MELTDKFCFFFKSGLIFLNKNNEFQQVKSHVTNYVAEGRDLCFTPATGDSKCWHSQTRQLPNCGSRAPSTAHRIGSIPETCTNSLKTVFVPVCSNISEVCVKAPTWIRPGWAASARWTSAHRWSGPAVPSPQRPALVLIGCCNWPQPSRSMSPIQSGNRDQSSICPSTAACDICENIAQQLTKRKYFILYYSGFLGAFFSLTLYFCSQISILCTFNIEKTWLFLFFKYTNSVGSN